MSATAKVYRDYDQAELNRAYTQTAWAASAETVISWYAAASASARESLHVIADISYGPGAAECLDYFPVPYQGAPVVIYVHGGAWTDLTKAESAFAAPAFVGAGIAFIALDFATIPSVRLPAMVQQVQRAIRWVHDHADELGISQDRVHLVGHSSGAHLVAAALSYVPTHQEPMRGLVRSALCASGSYDLEPVMLSHRGAYLSLDPEEAVELSPILNIGRLAVPLAIAYGGRESPEFKRQARDFAARLQTSGCLDGLLCDEGEDHFTISTTLARRDGFLARIVLEKIAAS